MSRHDRNIQGILEDTQLLIQQQYIELEDKETETMFLSDLRRELYTLSAAEISEEAKSSREVRNLH